MSIIQRQNQAEHIKMLAAQRGLYSTAKTIMGTQMILSGPVAVVATLVGIACPDVKGYVTLWGLMVLFFDLIVFTPWQKKLRDQAAKIQELFDCSVLGLSWNEIKVGKKPEPELIHEQATKFGTDPKKMDALNDWYPLSVQNVPAQLGVIICQRTNVWWDAKLRRTYAATVFTTLIFTTFALIGYGAYKHKDTLEFIAFIVAPMASAYVLGWRQITEHRDAADRLDKLRDHSEKLWSEAIGGSDIAALMTKSRLLQDEIFDGRKKNPPIFDFIFKIFRDENQIQMNIGAEALIAEAKKAG